MTSNIASAVIQDLTDKKAEEWEIEARLKDALKQQFRPEFLNRIDEIITFKPLSIEDVEKIVELQMEEIRQRLAEHGLKVTLSERARKWLAKEGFDPAYGARPLRRALQKYVESPLSVQMLRGDFKSGDTVEVDYAEDKGVNFCRAAAATTPPETDAVPAA